jgi:transposase
MIEARGCRLEYLPPYSPDFNPIEYSFSAIKKAAKDHFQIHGNETPDEFTKLVLRTGLRSITPESAKHQFRNCGVHVD